MSFRPQYLLLLLYSVAPLSVSVAQESGTSDYYQEMVEEVSELEAVEFEPEADIENSLNGMAKDIVLILDNSVSMKKNDPDFLMRDASVGFINKLGQGARIAIVIFDLDINLALPLTNVFDASKENIVNSLEKLNYQGLFSDSPAAVERGLYELRNNARESAQKIIIFVTDGSPDTGDLDVDIERTRSLREELKGNDIYSGIRFYGIGLTESADQLFLQDLVDNLEGQAFLIQEASELDSIFTHVDNDINQFVPQELEIEPEGLAPDISVAEAESAPLIENPVPVQVPVQAAMGKEERTRSIIIIVSAAILIIALIAIIVLLVRRNREFKAASGYEVEAYLNDYRGYTSQASYKLDSKPTMLGRVAGKDSDHLNFIVIAESTIGRRHALIDYKDYGYWISDQGSINGTFVNDKHITSEVRLKHGDKVRLHKYEFEFVMPETSGASATVVSSTVVASEGVASSEAEAVLQEVQHEMSQAAAELDFDFGEAVEEAKEEPEAQQDSVDETLMPSAAAVDEVENYVADDETLLPGADNAVTNQEELDTDDETLMPGSFEPVVDEVEEQQEVDTSSYENFFDLTGDSEEEDKKE